MVGPPKTLYDLRRIEAALRVTCRACGSKRTVDRELTIRDRIAYRRSLEWSAVRADLPCWKCDSTDTKVDAVPFGENNPELRARRIEARRLNLALTILNDAAGRNSAMPVPAIQLALRVLHPYVGDRELLVTYWNQVQGVELSRPWGGGHQALRWIVTKLVDRGWPIWAEFR